MLFSTSQLVTFTLAAASTAIAAPVNEPRAQSIIIGYRTVKPDVYERYVKAGNTLTDEPANGIQLGQGAYTAPIMDSWPAPDSNYMCVVLASKDKIMNARGVSKAWIAPKSKDDIALWYKPDNIDKYIKGLEDSWTPAKTLRLGMISGRENEPDKNLRRQLLIPPGLLNSNGGGLDISVQCALYKDRKEKLPDVVVNYDDWEEDIKGDEHEGKADIED